jgi:hypothetical protein
MVSITWNQMMKMAEVVAAARVVTDPAALFIGDNSSIGHDLRALAKAIKDLDGEKQACAS